MVRILVVEDDATVRDAVAAHLVRSGHEVDAVADGPTAVEHYVADPADLVLLDLMLPGMGGLEVCRRLRSMRRDLPLIMVTARAQEHERVQGLQHGADDYLTKPFSLRELSARVRALLRRSQGPVGETEAVYRGRQIVADFDAVSVTVDGSGVRLTRREFELLKCLVENRNRVLSRERLLERVWGYDRLIETRSVDVHVGRLRAKLGSAGRQIETAVGLGYRFVE